MLTGYQRGHDAFEWVVAPPLAMRPDTETATDPDEPQPLPVIKTDEDLDRFLLDYFGVKLPNVACCKNHTTPWHAFHDAYFARSPVSVWKASRGFGGKSFTLGLLGLAEGLTLRADVNILGGSGEQAKRILETVTKLWEMPTAPRAYLVGEPGTQKQKLKWGNRIVALLASQASVRGPHPQRLRMDEVDEMDLAILKSAMGQPMSKGWVLSQVVLSSTHQYADGTMTWALRTAGEMGWPVYEWCLEETKEPHGWLSNAEIVRKMAIMTADHWRTEVLLQEPSSEGRAITTELVETAFRADLKLEPPVAGARYGTGADWAKKVNHTVVVSIRHDVTPCQVVAVKRTQKEPWPTMAGHYDAQARAYPGTNTHDNTGIGQVVHDLLNVDADPFDMIGRQRSDLLSEYIAAIEHGELVWPRDDSNPALAAAYSEHKYASRESVYRGTKDGSSKHHLPDTVSAGALAWRATQGVIASGAVKDPAPDESPHLQHPPERGRLSGYIHGRRQ